ITTHSAVAMEIVYPADIKGDKRKASVLLLMDSIGKNIEPQKLFPRQRVLALHCRNTERVHELFTNDDLGSPQCIIIHTGTNDLHRLNEGTAKAMHEMAEKASQTFPTSRVLISTLLPRLDVPPSVIDQINEEVRHSCSSLPNVHLVHHSSVRPWHLYDGLHLNQDGVRIFAKAIKDVALGPILLNP
uniref:SGNH hydrolase-type esterase domain-containing protein n=1 Tax=Sinocyclocheilus grahami TaxID=75366 RepID=A0A672KDD4_SINGR